jgi:hypothetical protein
MIVSGHTFVVTLFAMGCYEQLRVVMGIPLTVSKFPTKLLCLQWVECTSASWPARLWWTIKVVVSKRWRTIKVMLLAVVSLVAIGEQAVELYVVGLSRFHYSVDMATAVVITFLMYTNSAIAMVSKQFELRGLYYFIGAWPSTSKIDTETQKERYREWPYLDVWSSKGDVYIPWCCIPFCCISGRAHVYGDDGILELLVATEVKVPVDFQEQMTGEEEVSEFIERLRKLADDMNLFEGVSAKDLWNCLHSETKGKNVIEKWIEEMSGGSILYKDNKDIQSLQELIQEVGGDNGEDITASQKVRAFEKLERRVTVHSMLSDDLKSRADSGSLDP